MHEYLRVSLHSRYHLGNHAIVAAEIRAARLTRSPPFPRGVSDGKIATMGRISVRAFKKEARRDKREDTSCSAGGNLASFKGLDRCSDISSETGIHRIVYRARLYRVTRPTKG